MRCIEGVDTSLFFTIVELPILSDPHCTPPQQKQHSLTSPMRGRTARNRPSLSFRLLALLLGETQDAELAGKESLLKIILTGTQGGAEGATEKRSKTGRVKRMSGEGQFEFRDIS